MKKILNLATLSIICFSIVGETMAYVPEFANNADYLATKDIIQFQANKEDYKLGRNITRGEASKIIFGLYNEFNSDDIFFKCDETYFKDVKKDNKFCDYIAPLVDNNVFKKAEFFNVNKNLTRSEMVLLLGRILQIKPSYEAELNFKDVSNKTDYYGYLSHFVEQGWLRNADSFNPNKYITRGEVFTLIARILK